MTIAVGNGALEAKYMLLLIAYARELEERIARMQAAGDALIEWVTFSDGLEDDVIKAWRNA